MRKKILYILCALALIYPCFLGYKYYRRCTYLPVRYPFLSANSFRYLCDYSFDQSTKVKIIFTGKSFDPSKVLDGDILFIKSDAKYLEKFFTHIHPHIHAKYALLSHNGDETIPGAYAKYLNEETLVAWFGCNVGDLSHPKMVPIPIGIMGILNKKLPVNCEEIWGRLLIDIDNGKIQKDKWMYVNFDVKNNPIERGTALEAFRGKGFCVEKFNRPYEDYLREMATFKFVVSPQGNGLDCYRTWEALMLGCIPIVKKSSLDVLYEGLPVVIVDQWDEVTEELLEKKYAEMSGHTYQIEKLQIDYWVRKIHAHMESNTSRRI